MSVTSWGVEAGAGAGQGASAGSTPAHTADTGQQLHKRSLSLPCSTQHRCRMMRMMMMRMMMMMMMMIVRAQVPAQPHLLLLYSAPHLKTYRFHSGLGGDIAVTEVMLEPRIAFAFPQQLL